MSAQNESIAVYFRCLDELHIYGIFSLLPHPHFLVGLYNEKNAEIQRELVDLLTIFFSQLMTLVIL